MSKPIQWTKKHRREALTRLFELGARYVMRHGKAHGVMENATSISWYETSFRAALKSMGMSQANIDHEVRHVNGTAKGARVRTLSYGVRAAPKRKGLSLKASIEAANSACARLRARRNGKPWTQKDAHRAARECGGTVILYVRRGRVEKRR